MRCLDFGAPEALELATRLLREEKVVVLPTESLYGFSALADSEAALRRIEALKDIPRRRSLLALVEGFEAIEPFLHPQQEPRSLELLRRVWPAALTAVLRVREPLAWGEGSEGEWTAAFRVPAHPRLRALLARLGRPVVSTSVNRTGAAPARGEAEIRAAFGDEEDLALFRDRRLEESSSGAGSTVVDARHWPPLVLRAGAFDFPESLRRAGLHGLGSRGV
jgi:tRNA threonylcarbamoyl adenosine modification protein (Sua5/YciO/YrdC/YwlC family)